MKGLDDEVKKNREPNYDIHPLLVNRWSPRAMTGEEISDEKLMTLFEAARWAPSSYNSQLWRFIYAKRESEDWDKFFDLLVEFNQSWCKDASALVVITSRKKFEHNDKPSSTHEFDTGSAWENLALEGTHQDLVVHGMEGFDSEKAREVLNIPEDYGVHAMAAIGKRAPKETLPEDLQEQEYPKGRRPLQEIVMEGEFEE